MYYQCLCYNVNTHNRNVHKSTHNESDDDEDRGIWNFIISINQKLLSAKKIQKNVYPLFLDYFIKSSFVVQLFIHIFDKES